MSVIAFIPARGGSKGIPRKNLRLLAGKPLIQYTIEAAQKSRQISEIFLSSDDDEIIHFCQSLGVETPYKRPCELAEDTTSMVETILHSLQWLQEERGTGKLPENLLLLQPTSPLRTSQDIDQAITIFLQQKEVSLVSVHKMTEHPCDCVVWGKESEWEYLIEPPEGATGRQDYPQVFYTINGCIYLIKTEVFLKKKSLILKKETNFYEIIPERGIDIDEITDFHLAEAYLSTLSMKR